MTLSLPVLALLLACTGGGTVKDADGTLTQTGTDGPNTLTDATFELPDDTAPEPDTGTVETGDTGTVGGEVVDCAALPTDITTSTLIAGASAYHGIVFDDAGNLLGTDRTNMIATDYYGGASVFRPNTGSLEQLDRLADGTIIAGDFQGIHRIETSGAMTLIASVPSVYGVKVGPDGMVYAADWSRIVRVDPVTGFVETWLDGGSQFSPKVIDFNVDFTKAYMGSIFEDGRVYVVDVDANMDAVGTPTVFAQTDGSWHDGIGVDICGNVYVAEYNTSSMYRINHDGSLVGVLFDLSSGNGYGHGLVWGNGVGGFKEDALYIPQPYNGDTVSEVPIEVPYRTWTGTVLNAP